MAREAEGDLGAMLAPGATGLLRFWPVSARVTRRRETGKTGFPSQPKTRVRIYALLTAASKSNLNWSGLNLDLDQDNVAGLPPGNGIAIPGKTCCTDKFSIYAFPK